MSGMQWPPPDADDFLLLCGGDWFQASGDEPVPEHGLSLKDFLTLLLGEPPTEESPTEEPPTEESPTKKRGEFRIIDSTGLDGRHHRPVTGKRCRKPSTSLEPALDGRKKYDVTQHGNCVEDSDGAEPPKEKGNIIIQNWKDFLSIVVEKGKGDGVKALQQIPKGTKFARPEKDRLLIVDEACLGDDELEYAWPFSDEEGKCAVPLGDDELEYAWPFSDEEGKCAVPLGDDGKEHPLWKMNEGSEINSVVGPDLTITVIQTIEKGDFLCVYYGEIYKRLLYDAPCHKEVQRQLKAAGWELNCEPGGKPC